LNKWLPNKCNQRDDTEAYSATFLVDKHGLLE
jgi:hypothetical protein